MAIKKDDIILASDYASYNTTLNRITMFDIKLEETLGNDSTSGSGSFTTGSLGRLYKESSYPDYSAGIPYIGGARVNYLGMEFEARTTTSIGDAPEKLCFAYSQWDPSTIKWKPVGEKFDTTYMYIHFGDKDQTTYYDVRLTHRESGLNMFPNGNIINNGGFYLTLPPGTYDWSYEFEDKVGFTVDFTWYLRTHPYPDAIEQGSKIRVLASDYITLLAEGATQITADLAKNHLLTDDSTHRTDFMEA